MTPPSRISTLTALLLSITCLTAETVKDREGAVRQDRATMSNNDRWIYNDYEKGFEEGRRTGKPVLVVIRCVPCLGCAGIDSAVLMANETLNPLLDQFVCVRVINANALDLTKFQFDFDLSFSTLFFNGDGTLYGRYGSWVHQKDQHDKTTAGYVKALEGALAIHQQYPENKPQLAGKQGGPTPYKNPVDIPALNGKYSLELDWQGKVVASCVHCHQIGDAFRDSYRSKGQPIPIQWIYPFPAPETIGLSLADDGAARIEAIQAGSAAAKAGLQAGDEILELEGQPLISSADVTWVLHTSPNAGKLQAVVRRGSEKQSMEIPLPPGWRTRSDIGRRVGTWPMRRMAFGGMKMRDMTDEERAQNRLGKDGMALLIEHVGKYGQHRAALQEGFKVGDILVSVGSLRDRMEEGYLIGKLLTAYPKAVKIPSSVIRNGRKVDIKLPLQQ